MLWRMLIKRGAESSGFPVQIIDIAQLKFPLLRTQGDFDHGAVTEVIRQAQNAIKSAQHLVIIYPLWLGSMPAYLKASIEQVFRPGFAAIKTTGGKPWKEQLSGKTAHIVITMGMPAVVYRWYFLAHSLKSLERNILGFCGIKTTQETLIGSIESVDEPKRKQWLDKIERLGGEGK